MGVNGVLAIARKGIMWKKGNLQMDVMTFFALTMLKYAIENKLRITSYETYVV